MQTKELQEYERLCCLLRDFVTGLPSTTAKVYRIFILALSLLGVTLLLQYQRQRRPYSLAESKIKSASTIVHNRQLNQYSRGQLIT